MGSDVNVWPPIEGETPIDPSGLKDRSIKMRAELNKAEAENIRKAHIKYLAVKPTKTLAPFDYSWIVKLHKEMYGDVWRWAGEIRRVELWIGVSLHQVTSQLMALAQDVAYWEDLADEEWIAQAARLHHRAVVIHPFMNGNGRWARMLANIWLRVHDQPLVAWPEATIGTESAIRKEYLETLWAADEGDLERLIELHRKYAQ